MDEGWVSVAAAAKRLEMTAVEVRECIERGELDAEEDEDGREVVLAEDVEDLGELVRPVNGETSKRGIEETITRKVAKTQRKSSAKSRSLQDDVHAPQLCGVGVGVRVGAGGPPLVEEFADCPKSPGGLPMLTTAEAATALGIRQACVAYALRAGMLDGWKVEGRWLVHFGSLQRYAERRGLWASARGHLGFHREQKKRLKELYASSDQSSVICDQLLEPLKYEYWISEREAANTLQVCRWTVTELAKRHGLRREKRVLSERANPRRRGVPRARMAYVMQEIEFLRDERERAVRTISPTAWRQDLQHPVVRTKIEAPPGDHLITRSEAAEMLGIAPVDVSKLVSRGRLFGWQKQPGQRGSCVWLSKRQVIRYADDPDRIRRSRAWREGKRSGAPIRTNPPEWAVECGLVNEDGMRKQPTSERDYGVFFSTRQTAKLLGISTAAVAQLRHRCRLTGHRAKHANPRSRGAWWFYRKDDVYDLLADPKYRRAHRAGMKAQQNRRNPKPLSEEELYEFIKINAFGRPPRGQIIETGWSWGDSRLYHISPFVRDPGDPPGGCWDAETWREMLK